MTVLEARVHSSAARNARLAFVVTTITIALLAATVAADQLHPILAALLGVGIGLAAGIVVWLVVRVWPVIRLLWWWLPEIGLSLAVVYGWTALATHTTLPVRLAVLGLVVGVPAVVPAIRRRIIALAWCVIVRHRLRVCFSQFIIANRSGSLPLILWARPTPVGERVWIYLRAGLSVADLERQLDKIAVTCHASAALVERASDGNAAYLRLDIKRREVLTADVDSPLVGLVDPDHTPPSAPAERDVPTALDLPDVADPTTTGAPRLAAVNPTGKTSRTNGATRPTTTPAEPASVMAGGEDITDWI